jgi:pantothenate kinase
MLVRDIYGDNSPFKELQGDILASSFAKMANDTKPGSLKERYSEDDVLNSLVTMISFNIGQLAYYSSALHNIKSIYFVGGYVRNNFLGM